MVRTARTTRPTRVGAVALTLAAVIAMSGCGDDDPDQSAPEASTEASRQAEDIDEGTVEDVVVEPTDVVEEVLQDPSARIGDTIAVQAVVGEILGSRAFTLVPETVGEPQLGPLLAIAPTEDATTGELIWVSGTIEGDADQEELSERFGTDLANLDLAEFEGEPWLDVAALQPAPA